MPYTAVIPTGVDTGRFRPMGWNAEVRDMYGIGGSPLILYVGRVAFEKNIDSIIRNMPRVADKSAKFLIVGDGPARKQLEQLVHSLGLQDRIIFAGFVPDNRLVDYYAASDIFISASKFETQGLSMLEAMSCGKPVVSINYRAVTDFIVDGQNGYLFSEFSDNMAETIDRALTSDGKVRVNARRTAESYSKEKTAKTLSDLYSKVLDMHINGQ
jgi:1,2-diacylglycerol 3-alpha-glucosyltransferase